MFASLLTIAGQPNLGTPYNAVIMIFLDAMYSGVDVFLVRLL